MHITHNHNTYWIVNDVSQDTKELVEVGVTRMQIRCAYYLVTMTKNIHDVKVQTIRIPPLVKTPFHVVLSTCMSYVHTEHLLSHR